MARSNSKIEIAISLDSIVKEYQGERVIDQVGFQLQEGEFLSLLGPSGSGKTTILRIVAGLVKPDSGSIILKGKNIEHIPPHLRNMGMVFQQYALFPHLTVYENVAYGLKARRLEKKVMKERVSKYLELVDLLPFAKRKPKELSGGQQQRVSLARALATEPILLLFDEPLSNLDARLKEQMLHEIHTLHRTLGFTAIYVTHDQNEALYLSDKIAVLNHGKIEQFASPEKILQHPKTPFVADFFGYVNRLEDAILQDNNTATVGQINVPIGHQGINSLAGKKGQLFIRPNAIQVAEYQQTLVKDKGNLPAVVLDARYRGGETEVQIQLVNEAVNLTAVIPKMIVPSPKQGEQISIVFDSSGICFFPGDDSDE
ncbi:putative spermidine/putrescine transport system ATP-binding protein [Seinonella peptonophila]|uniref:Carnitine transport ATP-binding protein OpuCA n=1 Tax=Seinonella peptonophila TaxID=112248 RepID=A0A1M4SPA0_9BACL|nr:ABC transporter ATP-binding protein [Seinonella peptonophila]SHE34050.1 putative spermidine/putrescine transport system ATP-binding protein [Seinonella peptonophila]